MSHESWRDVRPFHAPNLLSPRNNNNDNGDDKAPVITSTPAPMKPFGSQLVAADKSGDASPDPYSELGTIKSMLSSDYSQSKLPPSDFGFRPYGTMTRRPFKVYAGFHMTRQARLWHSETVDRVIATAAARPVPIPSEGGVTFATLFGIIGGLGATAYAYGGVLRDVVMKGEHVADDIDVLFSCTVEALVEALEARGWREGDEKRGLPGDFWLKRDEATGAKRYDYIAVGEGKAKFSGHTLDSNCAGEFAFNCMLYDVERRLLIDASGWGLQDSAFNFLRIPYDGGHISPDGRSQWELWAENCDRLPGMISLRFFNFRSRGYGAAPPTVELCARWLKTRPPEALARTLRTFFKRKVLKKPDQGGAAAADRKLATFRGAVVADFDAVFGAGEGARWWDEIAAPIAAELLLL